MTETVVIDKMLHAPANKVWAAIEGVGGLDRWFPIISDCRVEGTGVGALRVLTLANGAGEMHDRIIETAPRERRLRYHRTKLPFPVDDYFGTVEVSDAGAGASHLVWTVTFESAPEHAGPVRDLVFGAISDGVDGLERELMQTSAA
jgi:hypothetical protein